MKGATVLLLMLMLATPPVEVVVRESAPLTTVAERVLGDARGASELKALNGLTSDTVPAGTTLRLPPEQERQYAMRSLETARNALEQMRGEAPRREEARARLKDAQDHFHAARYGEAARAADSAWQLVSAGGARTIFTVKVDEQGATDVLVKEGPPVRVKADNVTRTLHKDEALRVEKGQPPPPPPPLLSAPRPTAPSPDKRLTFKPVNGLLGPVRLEWEAVSGAQSYEVEVFGARGPPLVLSAPDARAQLPALPAGRYRWTVRAVGQGAKSEASATRRFELVEGRLSLEVKGSGWK